MSWISASLSRDIPALWIWLAIAATAVVLVYPLLSWVGSKASWRNHEHGQIGYLGDLLLLSIPNFLLIFTLDFDMIVRPPGATPLLLLGGAVLAAIVLRVSRQVVPPFRGARTRLIDARISEMSA